MKNFIYHFITVTISFYFLPFDVIIVAIFTLTTQKSIISMQNDNFYVVMSKEMMIGKKSWAGRK